MQQQTAQVNGTPLRWLEQGSGLPVVLVHGIPTSPALWRHVMPRLPGMRVLAFEMTGHGDSIPAGRGRDVSVGAQADRLNAWLDHLGINRAVWSVTTSAAASSTSRPSAAPTCALGC